MPLVLAVIPPVCCLQGLVEAVGDSSAEDVCQNPILLSAVWECIAPARLGWHAEPAGFLTRHHESDALLLQVQSLGYLIIC